MTTYQIKEIFGPTIQGEGSQAGTAVLFLRFAGCNRWSGKPEHQAKSVCWFCDTDFLGGVGLSTDEILQQLGSLGACKTIVISGGEATLQLDEEILIALTRAGYRLHLETNGSSALGQLYGYFDHITMSPKQSPERTKLEACDDLKLLFPSPIEGVDTGAFHDFPAGQRFVQPVDGPQIAKNQADVIAFCCSNPEWRLSLQLHKMIGVR